MTTQRYTVRVYERPYEYDVEADNPADAQDRIIAAHWSCMREEIDRVEVVPYCAHENALPGELCDDCGAEL
jgi:hypothetical protein